MISKFLLKRTFVREYSSTAGKKFDLNELHKDAPKMAELWKKITFFVAFPTLALGCLNAYLLTQEEHKTLKRPEFVHYDFMYIRNKRFPWGDGNHTLFHNPYRNALPDGYETDEEEHH